MVMLRLHYDYVVASAIAAAPARREAVLWLRTSQETMNLSAVPSAGSLSLLPASWLVPCLPWVQ